MFYLYFILILTDLKKDKNSVNDLKLQGIFNLLKEYEIFNEGIFF